MALGSFVAMAIVSLPTLNALRELGVSVDKLSKVVSEEVPGTLSSLKLSGFEIHELTQHLSKIRKIISGNQFGKDGEPKKSRSKGGRKNPDV